MGEGTGEANALYWLRRGGYVWVLRRPPAVINAPGASDMNREARMQHLVDGPDEVHRWRIGRKVLAAQRQSGTVNQGRLPRLRAATCSNHDAGRRRRPRRCWRR